MYLSLKDIVKVFAARGGVGEVAAVNHINLEIEKGELVTLLGPSGCGKTTTLRMIAGFEFPTAGSISLDGLEINMLPPNKRDMSMVFQSYAIFPHLNVYENIAYGLNVRHVAKEDVKRRVATVLELVQLTGYENRAPNQLSGGQQQRVALARALVMEPKVLLMDEPLSNLDAKLREQMRTEIRRIQRDIGITSVYVTHDQVEAMTLSDRVVVMNQGIIEQVGAPQEIYRYPKTRFVADFIGRANFLDARSLGGENGNMLVEFSGHQLALEDVRQQQPAGIPVTLIVRPEMVHVRDQGLLQGVVRRASFLGNLIDYEIEINGSLISAVETDPTRMTIYPEGSSVGVDFANECIHVLPA